MHARIFLVSVLFVIFFCGLQTAFAVDDPAVSMPLAFTANEGQWADDILFRADAGGTTLWFTANGIYYQFTRRVATAPDGAVADVVSDKLGAESFSVETILVKGTFVGANPAARMIGEDLLEYRSNYFLGDDQTTWRSDVRSYGSVVLEDIYPGIDIRFSGAQSGRPMYEVMADIGSDPAQVQVAYDGAVEAVSNIDGSTTVLTEWGTTLEAIGSSSSHYAPISDALGEDGVKSFSATGEIVYSTYLGGADTDQGYGIAVDADGSAYITGYTFSSDFPAQNAYDNSLNGYRDVFVSKLSPDGQTILYSTFIGGTQSDYAVDVAVDASGCAYLAGYTSSTDFPAANPYNAPQNGAFDVFVAKFSSDGSALTYAMLLGGEDNDCAFGVAVDASGCAYVGGYAYSDDFPTMNGYDETYNGCEDIFVAKLTAAGDALAYSTLIGGGDSDIAFDLALDGSGRAYVTGYTNSLDFPLQNAFDASNNGNSDVFVCRLTASGDALSYSTLLGGANSDVGYNLTVDASACAFVVGGTHSPDFPMQNAYDASYAGDEEIFVTKFSSDGSTLSYSTYLGGVGRDRAHGIAVDAYGCAYLAGFTTSDDFPVLNAYDDTHNGDYDAFASKLSATGNSLIISTFLGGSESERAYAMAMDEAGYMYMTGRTGSSDFPLVDPYDNSLGGTMDAFVVKMGLFASSCCDGETGNINCDSKDAVDISDLTMLVNHLFITFDPLCCLDEANTNGDPEGRVDISDLMHLVNHLFITYEDLATLD